jgi:hypothetical protein
VYGRRPLTKLEAGLFAGLVGIFLVFFAWQALEYMELAERATMEATLMNTASAINTRLAQETLDRQKGAADWARRNPFEIARVHPPNYAGEIGGAAALSGSWRYDSARAELIYTPRLHFRLQISNGEAALRFRLMVQGTGGYNLLPVTPYRWE